RSWTRSSPKGASKFSTYACSYCGKAGHKAEFCWTRLQPNTGRPAMIVTEETNTSPVGVMAGLSKADSMPIALVSTKGEARESAVSVLASRDFDPFQESFAKDPDVPFVPFCHKARDSGCLQTLIKEGVVAARKTDKYVVLGSLWGQGVAPLFLVRVKSSCFSGIANVACVHELPVAGVDLILGNDLAGGQMGNVTPPPVLRERPESTAELQQLEDDMPGVFPLCAVTRSMSVTNDHNVTPDVDDSLSLKGLFANPVASQDISYAVNAVTGRVALIAAQEQDDSLRLLFYQVSGSANDSDPTTRYFITSSGQWTLSGDQHCFTANGGYLLIRPDKPTGGTKFYWPVWGKLWVFLHLSSSSAVRLVILGNAFADDLADCNSSTLAVVDPLSACGAGEPTGYNEVDLHQLRGVVIVIYLSQAREVEGAAYGKRTLFQLPNNLSFAVHVLIVADGSTRGANQAGNPEMYNSTRNAS
ncbi:hypothetical protein Hamer_G025532, partial [Homarus americanus]